MEAAYNLHAPRRKVAGAWGHLPYENALQKYDRTAPSINVADEITPMFQMEVLELAPQEYSQMSRQEIETMMAYANGRAIARWIEQEESNGR